MKRFSTSSTRSILTLLLVAVSFYLFTNLDYNSPFSDEAIYVAIGKSRLMDGNWDYYDAISWMTGHPYFYPPLTTLAYTVNGIIASRALNVFLFIIYLFIIYKLTTLIDKKNTTSGLIAVIVLGFSSVSFYVSRLATYDIPSYLLLMTSIFTLTESIIKNKSQKRSLMLASILFFLAFCFKYVVLFYAPLLLLPLFFFFYKNNFSFAKEYFVYFLLPFGIMLSLFLTYFFEPLFIVYQEQIAHQSKQTLVEVLNTFTSTSNFMLLLYVVSSLLMLKQKRLKLWLTLSIISIWIVISHIVSQRVHTLDKHVFLTVTGFAIIAGIGLSESVKANKILLTLLLTSHVIYSTIFAQNYNNLWINTKHAEHYVQDTAKSNSNILTELGASTPLALMETIPLENITTFDYFEYENLDGDYAYEKAIEDQYFTYILMYKSAVDFENFSQLHMLVKNTLQKNSYVPTFEDENIIVYESTN